MYLFCIWCYRRVFFCDYVGYYCTDITWKTDKVSSCNKSCPVRFELLGYEVTKKLAMGDILLPVCWYFFMFQENMVLIPFTLSPTPCDSSTNSLVKYFTDVFLCLSHFIRCIYSSDSPDLASMIDFSRILRY